MSQKLYLCLEDGYCQEGVSFGAPVDSAAGGRAVFSTAMLGHVSALTDPASTWMIMAFTYPLIGNVGVIEGEMMSPCVHAAGVVVHDYCGEPSNFAAGETLDALLKRDGVPGISGIDVRDLTLHLREHGSQKAVITPYSPKEQKPDFGFKPPAAGSFGGESGAAMVGKPADRCARVALVDFGVRASLVRELESRGVELAVVSATATAADIKALGVGGVVLSDGFGDPSKAEAILANVAEIAGLGLPVFACGFGHLALAAARGGELERLKFGHHGQNESVKAVGSGELHTTSQNHIYAVKTPPNGASVSFSNLHDNSCEGLEYPGEKIISLQFEPGYGCEKIYDTFVKSLGE